MRGKAKARWVMAALAHMTQSNAAAATILHAHGATAATDVTGFGLLGHLVEMVRASDVDATLDLAAFRCWTACAKRSAWASSPRCSRRMSGCAAPSAIWKTPAAPPLYPVLFDPQTAGGLLASIPGHRAAACLAALRRRRLQPSRDHRPGPAAIGRRRTDHRRSRRQPGEIRRQSKGTR